MFYIGLDLGLHLGWSVFDGDNLYLSGSYRIGKKVCGESIAALRTFLEDLLPKYQPCVVQYEEVKQFHKSKKAASAFGIYEGILLLVCYDLSINQVQTIGTTTLKKLATGGGKAEKIDMEYAAKQKWGFWAADDNEADALWIGWCATQELHS